MPSFRHRDCTKIRLVNILSSKGLSLVLCLVIGLIAACSGTKSSGLGQGAGPEGDGQSVLPIVDGEPMPGGFDQGVYAKQQGTCEANSLKLGIGKGADGHEAVWGLSGVDPIPLETIDGKKCFPWKEGTCCLKPSDDTLAMSCSFDDGTTCDSIYRKDSDFDIDSVFASTKATAVDAAFALAGASPNDVTVNNSGEGASIETIGNKVYATILLANIDLEKSKPIFSPKKLAIYQPPFDARSAIIKESGQGPTCCQFVGDRYAYDPADNHKLYVFKKTSSPGPIASKLLQFIAIDAYLPRQSGSSLLWQDAQGKTLAIYDPEKSSLQNIALPADSTTLDAAASNNQIFVLTRTGDTLDVLSTPLNAPGKWASLGLAAPLTSPRQFDEARLFVRPGAIDVSVRGAVFITTCNGPPWEEHPIVPGDTIIALTDEGLFASEYGRLYALAGGQMIVELTIDFFVHKAEEKTNTDLLPARVVRYLESQKRLYFIATTQGNPDKGRYIGWFDRP